MEGRPIRVLVVDDSAVVRQVVTSLLCEAGGFEVAVAADGHIARQKLGRIRPDVVLLDLQMPRMDGLDFLRWLMGEWPLPVVICSGASTQQGADLALEALRLGALDIVRKPQVGLKGFLEESMLRLSAALRTAASVRPPRARVRAPVLPPPPVAVSTRGWARNVVAVGASTGGPEALRQLLGALPANAPGFVVVQHMPEPFVTSFARNLAAHSRMQVRRAEHGDGVREGLVLMAPGDRHVTLTSRAEGYVVEVSDAPPVHHHRPSVDVLFHSVASVAGPDAVGVVLTGMGSDGAEGLAAMRRAGAATFAQDAASSVVYGMPRAAVMHRAVEQSLPLDALAEAVLKAASSR